MANQITFGANIAPTTTPMEVTINGGTSFTPATFTTVGSNQQYTLANVPAGSYVVNSVGLRAVGYPGTVLYNSAAALTVSGATAVTRKILYLSVGDSITQGDQQGGVASGNTFPQRALARLSAAAPGVFTLQQQAYPGKSAKYFTDNFLSTVLASVTPANWDLIVVLLEFGANDLTPQTQTVGELHTVAGVTGYIQALADQFRAFSPKVKVALYPITNRTDSYSTATFDADRRAVNYNNVLAGTAHFDDVANLTDEPLLYATAATTNTTYFADQVHRTIAGADIDGRAAARVVARLSGIIIADGNLTTPTAADTSKYPAAAPAPAPAPTPAGSVVWADLQNTAYTSSNGQLSKIAGTDGWNAFATATASPVVGSVWSATVVKPTNAAASAIVSFASAKATIGQTNIGPNILLYWDNGLIRVFQNFNVLLETAFTNASYVLSMTVTATGFQFKRDGVLLLPEVAATTSGTLYLNAELNSQGNSIIPQSTLV